MDQFESFETKRFVQRLLGKGDVSGLMDKIQVRSPTGTCECTVLHRLRQITAFAVGTHVVTFP